MGECPHFHTVNLLIFWFLGWVQKIFLSKISLAKSIWGVGCRLENYRCRRGFGEKGMYFHHIYSISVVKPDIQELGSLNQRFGKNRFWLSSAIAFLKSTLRRNVFPVKLSRLLKILIPFCLCPLFVGFALGIP